MTVSTTDARPLRDARSRTRSLPLIACLLALAVTPGHAQAQAQAPNGVIPAAPAYAAADWRPVPADNLLVIDTNRGRILVEMTPEVAPLHVERMRVLARRGFFDGIVFHRVIDAFMAQTGDPLGTGDGQSPFPDLKAEFTFRRGPEMPFVPVAEPAGAMLGFLNSLPIQTQPTALMATTADGKVHGWGTYCPGVAGMARDEANDSANSQFFLMRQPYPALDKRYTVWGRVVSGLDVVRAIKVGDGDNGMVTADPDRMIRVRIAADLAEIDRPVVNVLNPSSAAFRTLMAGVRTARGADFSVCDVDLPVQVSGMGAPAA
ncbi:peptidylprolyl isomerase [Brevundimonas sp. R86498]|uniref:peptidylprolyl isomerase n=1 Tax=Brevundimonas sp. R86498 TaxID=3093845 RepID=UPI0037CA3847